MKHTARILIVDDEEGGRETLEALLIRDGYEMVKAANGQEAVAAATENPPDLVLLDVMMPGMNGFETCWLLRSEPKTAEIPIILVTALDDRDSRLAGLEAGADDFITKPYDRTELRTRVKSILRLNRYRRLLLERERLHWVLEQSEEGYVILREDGRVAYANPSARAWLCPAGGETEMEHDFLDCAGHRYQAQPPEAWSPWPGCLAEETARYLVDPQTDTADAVWLQVQARALPGEKGRVLRISDRSLELAARADLRSLRSTLFHKLLTPLNHICGGVDVWMGLGPSAPEEDRLESIGVVQRGVERLRGTVLDLVAYMNSGELEEGERFRVGDLPLLAERLRDEFKITPVRLRGVEEHADLLLRLSPRAVETVLWELFENSVKFHPSREPRMKLEVQLTPEGRVLLRVEDDGRTLSPAQIRRAWSPGYQGERYFTGEAAGSGLGLSLVAGKVWAAGGRCRLYNRTDGAGVVVELEIPPATVSRVAA